MESLENQWENMKDTMTRETTHMVMENLKSEMNDSEAGVTTRKELVGDAKEEILRCMKEEEDRKHRATNLVIYNVDESGKHTETERKKEDMEFCHVLIKKGVGMSSQPDVQEVVRLGKNMVSGKPRPLLVKLRNSMVKWQILRNAKNVKRSDVEKIRKVFVAPDLTKEQREWNKKLRDELKSKRDAGEIGWYMKGASYAGRVFYKGEEKQITEASWGDMYRADKHTRAYQI